MDWVGVGSNVIFGWDLIVCHTILECVPERALHQDYRFGIRNETRQVLALPRSLGLNLACVTSCAGK